MIRVGMPAPALLRMRIRAQLTAARVSRQAGGIREAASRRIFGIATFFRINQTEPQPAAIITSSQDTNLTQFEERYQCLIDLLCWSAKDGVKSEGLERYQSLRTWFLQNYESVRPGITRHLSAEDFDILPYSDGSSAPRDAFESLFLSENLDSLINSETVISRIQRTRVALDSYRDSLEAVAD